MRIAKSLKRNSLGVAINGYPIECPKNMTPYILANVLLLVPSSFHNATIMVKTSSYDFSASHGNFYLSMRLSSNTNSSSGLEDAALD